MPATAAKGTSLTGEENFSFRSVSPRNLEGTGNRDFKSSLNEGPLSFRSITASVVSAAESPDADVRSPATRSASALSSSPDKLPEKTELIIPFDHNAPSYQCWSIR